MNSYLKIILMVALCLGVGYLSGVATRSSIDLWYPLLEKPSFNPPNEVFFPVWTVLYIMMGVAGGLVWSKLHTADQARMALKYFFIQLVLNALWSVLFFGLRNPFVALIEIVLLWLMIYETFYKFIRVDKYAGWLMIPYLLWVSFAAVLNASIWYLNRG